jgi:hypothetical protein
VGDIHQMFYLMNISLSYYAQPLQPLLPDQDFWMTASDRTENKASLRLDASGVLLDDLASDIDNDFTHVPALGQRFKCGCSFRHRKV